MITEFIPTIEDVLKRPLFEYADVVAGREGLIKQIRWAHVLEIPDGASFINGGELILSTGIGFGEDGRKQLDYLDQLIEKKAAGLCIELGAFVPEISRDMIDLANQHHFPLIVFHRPVHFVEITKDLHEIIVNQHLQAIRELSTYAHDLQKLTLENQGLKKVMDHFQQYVNAQVFFAEIDHATHFAPCASQDLTREVTTLLHSSFNELDLDQKTTVSFILGQKKVLYQPIKALGHILAFVGVVLQEQESEEFIHLTLDYTSAAMAQILLRKRFVEERAFDEQQHLLTDMMEDRFKEEQQVRNALGIKQRDSFIPKYIAFILEVDEMNLHPDQQANSPFYDMAVWLRLVFNQSGFRALIRQKGLRLYILLIEKRPCLDTKGQASKMLVEMKRSYQELTRDDNGIRMGAGRISSQFSEVSRHFKEAEKVLSVSSDVTSPFFDDLGVYRIFSQTKDPYVLTSFVKDYLGPLIDYDHKHNSQLVLTLRVLFQCNGSKKEAADRLFIRRQTLYYRLEKIESILGEVYVQSNHRLCLELALSAHDWCMQSEESGRVINVSSETV